MNLEEAKKKLDTISKSTATKHPKVLISELCGIVGFLLEEVGRIESPNITVPIQPPRFGPPKIQPPWPNKDKERKTKRPDLKPWGFDSDEKRLNAGDAE